VLSDEESARVELDPAHKGVFAMYVFREGGGGSSLNISDGDDLAECKEEDGIRGLKATAIQKRGLSLAEVQARLGRATGRGVQKGKLVAKPEPKKEAGKRQMRKGDRGLLDEEAEGKEGSKLNRVPFKPDPEPAAAVFVRYYTTPPVAD
jgi:hypothetical protein